MKNSKNKTKTLIKLTVACLLFISVSCKKKENNTATTTPTNPTGILAVHLHTNIDTTEAMVDSVCKDVNGRQIKLSLAQFYASGIVAHKADGSSIQMTNVYVLKTIANEQYVIGSVPAGNYNSVSFNVGIDTAANKTAPSSYAATHVLSSQTPSMWFGSTAQGYIFMNVQGYADTSAANNGALNVPFSYQLGTNVMLKTVNLPNQPFTVVANGTQYVHIICDYGVLLNGVNFKTQSMASPFGTSAEQATAAQIANNITSMFRLDM